MKTAVSQKLLNSYANHGKNPNYSLSFLLNSLDSSTAAECMSLGAQFFFDDTKAEFELDARNTQAVQMIFGSTDAHLLEKLLWIAILFPEI